MATSRSPSKPGVTHLYDTRLPAVLRLRGFGLETKKEEPSPSPLCVSSLRHHALSPHVLELRAEPERPAPSAPARKRAELVENFDVFAKEFFTHLSIEEDIPAKEETFDETPLLEQIKEDDRTVSPTPRLHLPRMPRVRFTLPAVNLPHLHLQLPSFRHGSLPSFSFLHPSLRGVGVFVLLSFMFVLPLQAMQSRPKAESLKAELLSGGSEAFAFLEEGASLAAETDFTQARGRFKQAGSELRDARETLDALGLGTRAIAALLPREGKTLKTGEALLDVGYELSLSAERVGDGLDAVGNLSDTSLGTKVEVLERYLTSAIPHLSAATEALARVNPNLVPEEHAARFADLKRVLPALEDALNRLQSFSGAIKSVLGNEEKKRYLFVFQNNTEIRPTGGFIGSFAEVDIYRGEVERIHLPLDGSYNLQGSLRLQVEAPRPLTLINPRWEFQDANWFPDFKASAQKLLEFHAASGGPTVDGVVAVNAEFVTDLLEVLGPVEMPSYGRTITAENFILETQKLVETEYDKEANTPKQFLADLAPVLLARIKAADARTFVPLLQTLASGLNQKKIQLYMKDTNTQERIRDLGWSGEMARTSGDYLMVVNANIGGQKTDAVIEENVDVTSEIFPDGRIQNTVTITRTHHGIAGAPFTGVNNVNYVELFVPRGSRLLDTLQGNPPEDERFETSDTPMGEDADLAFQNASAFTGPGGTEVSELHGKTVFGNWTQTKPGQSSSITFTYELPFTVEWTRPGGSLFTRVGSLMGLTPAKTHTLTIEPQSGSAGRTTRASISFPSDREPLSTTDVVKDARVETTVLGTKTGFLGIVFE